MDCFFFFQGQVQGSMRDLVGAGKYKRRWSGLAQKFAESRGRRGRQRHLSPSDADRLQHKPRRHCANRRHQTDRRRGQSRKGRAAREKQKVSRRAGGKARGRFLQEESRARHTIPRECHHPQQDADPYGENEATFVYAQKRRPGVREAFQRNAAVDGRRNRRAPERARLRTMARRVWRASRERPFRGVRRRTEETIPKRRYWQRLARCGRRPALSAFFHESFFHRSCRPLRSDARHA